MNDKETYLEVNDYLDLYLLAGNLGDKLWQHEMIEKLQYHYNDISHHDPTLTLRALWNEYKEVNMEILELYNQVQQQSLNGELRVKIWDLKQRRMDLSRKINMEERKSQRHNS